MESVTKKPNVPALRFPEFSGEWEEIRLGDVLSKVGSGSTPKGGSTTYQESGILFLRSQNVNYGRLNLEEVAFISNETHQKMKVSRVLYGDVLLNITGASIGRSCIYTLRNREANVNQHVCILRGDVNSAFLHFWMESSSGQRQIFISQEGGGREGLNFQAIRKFRFFLVTQDEQEKVAAFLTVVDERFGLLKRKKELLEEYKKGVMQRLFSREIRFKDEEGNEYPEWEEKRLGEVLFEHKEKSNGTEQVHSVSVHKGVINQIEHLGRSFAALNTDNYNRVYPNDIIYTKSPTGNFPFGIIKRNQKDEEVIVSPLYGVFTAESPGLASWLDEFFSSEVNTHNYLSSIIQKGAKNTINITNRTFLTNSTLVPVDPNEQDRIGLLFGVLNDNIQLVTSEIEALSNFKRGLLQKMFV
jgi:type I restriction enzyme S subunit